MTGAAVKTVFSETEIRLTGEKNNTSSVQCQDILGALFCGYKSRFN